MEILYECLGLSDPTSQARRDKVDVRIPRLYQVVRASLTYGKQQKLQNLGRTAREFREMVETADVELVAKRLVMYIEKLEQRPGGRIALEDARHDAAERRVAEVDKEMKALAAEKAHNTELVRKYKKRKLDREGHGISEE